MNNFLKVDERTAINMATVRMVDFYTENKYRVTGGNWQSNPWAETEKEAKAIFDRSDDVTIELTGITRLVANVVFLDNSSVRLLDAAAQKIKSFIEQEA